MSIFTEKLFLIIEKKTSRSESKTLLSLSTDIVCPERSSYTTGLSLDERWYNLSLLEEYYDEKSKPKIVSNVIKKEVAFSYSTPLPLALRHVPLTTPPSRINVQYRSLPDPQLIGKKDVHDYSNEWFKKETVQSKVGIVSISGNKKSQNEPFLWLTTNGKKIVSSNLKKSKRSRDVTILPDSFLLKWKAFSQETHEIEVQGSLLCPSVVKIASLRKIVVPTLETLKSDGEKDVEVVGKYTKWFFSSLVTTFFIKKITHFENDDRPMMNSFKLRSYSHVLNVKCWRKLPKWVSFCLNLVII